jgi:chromosome segregation protein
MTGGVDEQMQTEYRETESRFQFLSQQAEDLRSAIRDLHETILELDSRIHKTFHEAFSKVSEKFSEYFRILFGGGRASMYVLKERTSARAPEEAEAESEVGSDSDHGAATKEEVVGIEIRAVPPGKKLAVLHALSGGERALTSIAFLCALLVSYPSPLVVLDEVDAALDEANSIRFAKILELLAAHTQVITITHNRETMRRSHTLYGVTMGEDGISKVLSIKLEKAEALAQ